MLFSKGFTGVHEWWAVKRSKRVFFNVDGASSTRCRGFASWHFSFLHVLFFFYTPLVGRGGERRGREVERRGKKKGGVRRGEVKRRRQKGRGVDRRGQEVQALITQAEKPFECLHIWCFVPYLFNNVVPGETCLLYIIFFHSFFSIITQCCNFNRIEKNRIEQNRITLCFCYVFFFLNSRR